jgi:transcriptional regulator with XRE-family HTH domain
MKRPGAPGGNRLKALREFYGRTQLDIELDASLGIGYLQRVESGKVQQPERETLERILAAMGARYTERRDVLELFGYIVDAPIPNDADIKWAVSVCQSEIDSAVFPVYLLDCAHRLLTWNSLVPQIFKGYPLKAGEIPYISMPRLIFDPAYHITPTIMNPEVFFLAQIRALRYEMQWFHDEAWYGEFIEDMLHCGEFKRYWEKWGTAQTHIPARPLTPLKLNLKEEGLLQFRLISEPFAQDRRFRVIYYLPADADTMQQCLAWFHSEDPQTQPRDR